MTIKYRIVCSNNSDARKFTLLDGLAKTSHNGGKIVIAMVESELATAVEAALDKSPKVAEYSVVDS